MNITVTLTGTWLTDPADHTSIQCTTPDRGGQSAVSAEVRQMAARRRVISSAPSGWWTRQTVLQLLTPDDFVWLVVRLGQTLLVRDQWGLRRWVMVSVADVEDLWDDGQVWHMVTVTMTETDHSEAV